MANQYRKFYKGLQVRPKAVTGSNEQGDLEVLSTDGKLRHHNGTTNSPVVTEAHTATLTNKTIDADLNTITNIENADIKVGAAIDAAKIADGSVSNAEFQYLGGVTSDIQDQLDGKLSSTLPDSNIFVGNASNNAVAVAVSGDVTITNTGNVQIASGVIVNADVNASAAIDRSKLASGTADHVIINSGSGVLSSEAQLAPTRGGTGVNNAGTLTYGANNVSLTTSGATSLTLPTSGTVATLAGAEALTNKTQVAVDNLLLDGNTISSTSGNLSLDAFAGSQLRAEDPLHIAEQATPATGPSVSSGYGAVYPGTDGFLYFKNDAGTVIQLGEAASGGGLSSVSPGATISGNYTILSGDNGRTLNVDSSAAPRNITLPSPLTGFKITIKDIAGSSGTNQINVLRAGSELIDGIASDDSIREDFRAISYVSDGTNWSRVASFKIIQQNAGNLALAASSTIIEAISFVDGSSSQDFGDLSTARAGVNALSNSTRAVFGGGFTGSVSNVIDYMSYSSGGNAIDFGDLSVTRYTSTAVSNSTRGIFAGGLTTIANSPPSAYSNVIDYITIASIGNATDFGDLTVTNGYKAGCQSSTRGVFAGGSDSSVVSNVIDYVTIASTGNATDFGDLTVARFGVVGVSSSTRGVFAGGDLGGVDNNTIDYITIASTGNATDFGDLSPNRGYCAPASNKTKGLFMGGFSSDLSVTTSDISQITIATTANSSAFGNLISAASYFSGGTSNCHGGL